MPMLAVCPDRAKISLKSMSSPHPGLTPQRPLLRALRSVGSRSRALGRIVGLLPGNPILRRARLLSVYKWI